MDGRVHLVPLGRNRYELYSEPSVDGAVVPPPDGFVRRHLHQLRDRWREAEEAVGREDPAAGRLARFRNWLVAHVAESIAEQRTLWSLRHHTRVELRYPSDLSADEATEERRKLLRTARWHHGVWMVVDAVLFAACGILAILPGPNVIAYYFGLRMVGHYFSWRGAGRGLGSTEWHLQPEPALEELRVLAGMPRAARATDVEAIAVRLDLPRLAAFFDRVAV